MNIEGFLKFIREVFGLLLLFKKLLLKEVNFTLEIRDALSLLLGVNELTLALLNLIL